MIVEIEDSWYSFSGAVVPVSTAGEKVALVAWEAWESDLGSESVNRHCLIPIVVHKNASDRGDGLLVLVWVLRVHEVERRRALWVSIGTCEIDTGNQGNVESSSQIVTEFIESSSVVKFDSNLSSALFVLDTVHVEDIGDFL